MSNGGTNQSSFQVNPPTAGFVAGTVAMSLDANNNPQAVSEQYPMPIIDGYQSAVITNWTSGTALNTAAAYQTAGYDSVALTIIPGGTITAGAITFEVYDGVNWFVLKSARESSYNTDSVFTLSGGAAQQAWTIPVAGYPQFRVRLSTQLTGTAPTATVTAIVSGAPDVSLVTAGLDPLQPGHPGVQVVQASQVVAIGAASAASAAVGANTSRVTLSATAACWVAFGAAPTAVANTTGNIYIPANAVLLPFAVTPGVTKIANIEAASGGFLSIIESL